VSGLRNSNESARWPELLAKARHESVPSFGFEFRAIEEVPLRPVAGRGFEGFDLKPHGWPDQGPSLEFGLKAIPQKPH
jgi:hypothetical protein